jgi:glycosyltransferase involved in cell wall biosynthesis
MKVSVLVITYNQERFIAEALKSILMQEVDFDYEIVVGEDASSDQTREVLLDLQSRHADKIRLLFRDKARSDHERAIGLPGKTNLIQAFDECRGEYIALLDGDDYWTSPHKLRKQVDFLDSHPECAICFHDAVMVHDDRSREPQRLCPPDQKEISTIEDLLAENFIPSCSPMFRRGLFGKFPDWFYTSKFGDWQIYILNAEHGKIGYINEVMGAYRVHTGGGWSSRNRALRVLEMIKALDYLDAHLGFRYREKINSTRARWYYELAEEYQQQGETAKATGALWKYLWICPAKERRPAKIILEKVLMLQTPALYRGLRSLRNSVRSATSSHGIT